MRRAERELNKHPLQGLGQHGFPFKTLAEATGIPLLGDLRYVAALIGVGLCLAYRPDLMLATGFEAEAAWVGHLLTGVVIGRGSNFLH